MTETERRLRSIETIAQRRRESEAEVKEIDAREYIAPVYYPMHDDIKAARHQYYNLPGGRGSGKSSFVSVEMVDGIMKDTTGESNGIVFRRTGNTMRDSVYSQIAWAIDALNVGQYWPGSVSPMCWTYKPTGAQILFRGLDDSTKIKSIKPKRGVFRYVWLEEFSELPGENFTRSVMQSVIRGGTDFIVFRSFNPPISKNNWANVFVDRPDPRAMTLHTSYLDMPAAWLGVDFITEAERLKEINPAAYEHEYMGAATGSGGEVFPNIEVRQITDAEKDALQYTYAGLDFGFAVDPACYMRVAYDEKHDTLYLLDEIYKKHCSNSDLADLIKAAGFDKKPQPDIRSGIFMDVIVDDTQVITADSAEPKSIADLRGRGLKVIACTKYPGSVNYGVKWLQSRHIVIDPARTPNAHREFTSYEYMKTKDGEFLADVPDKDNHSIDAVRYALDRLINRKKIPA